jgi:hypothetical protein
LKDIPLIVTTPNERVLRSVTNVLSQDVVHEIVGKPADLQQLTAKLTKLMTAAV